MFALWSILLVLLTMSIIDSIRNMASWIQDPAQGRICAPPPRHQNNAPILDLKQRTLNTIWTAHCVVLSCHAKGKLPSLCLPVLVPTLCGHAPWKTSVLKGLPCHVSVSVSVWNSLPQISQLLFTCTQQSVVVT